MNAPVKLFEYVVVTTVMAKCRLCEEEGRGPSAVGIQSLPHHLREWHGVDVCDFNCRHCETQPLFAKDVNQ